MKVACTVIGASVLGRMCFQMIFGTRVPAATAASTYGCSRSDSTTPRTRRETRGTSVMVMAIITLPTLPRVSAISAMASRMPGMDISPSITRITTVSRMRTKPEVRPMNMPMMEAKNATEMPTCSDTRVP